MRRTLMAVAVAVASLFAAFVWPTQWRYERVGQSSTLVRINRLNDRVQALRSGGWVTISYVPHSYTPSLSLKSPATDDPYEEILREIKSEPTKSH